MCVRLGARSWLSNVWSHAPLDNILQRQYADDQHCLAIYSPLHPYPWGVRLSAILQCTEENDTGAGKCLYTLVERQNIEPETRGRGPDLQWYSISTMDAQFSAFTWMLNECLQLSMDSSGHVGAKSA